MIKGKDGKEFDRARYTRWALYGGSSMSLQPWSDAVSGRARKGRGIRWTCPQCLQRFNGGQIKPHRESKCQGKV